MLTATSDSSEHLPRRVREPVLAGTKEPDKAECRATWPAATGAGDHLCLRSRGERSRPECRTSRVGAGMMKLQWPPAALEQLDGIPWPAAAAGTAQTPVR